MPVPERSLGFTLVEVLIALAITAFVSTVAYTSLSAVLSGAESLRDNADRTYEVNRAWMIISRDLRQFAPRAVRDEFGEEEPAMTGGPLARFTLSLTRSGWHNPNGHARSNLQRINYRVEGEALWRDSYYVLDRVGNTEPQSALLLEGVEYLELVFLPSLEALSLAQDGTALDIRNWAENWVLDTSVQGSGLEPPAAVQLTMQIQGWGEMRRLYALPPL